MPKTILFLCLLFALANGQLIQSLYSFLRHGEENLQLESQNAGADITDFDFIIVGAGTAGCVLANRLTENPNWRVLLIEAGDHENFIMDVPLMVQYLQRNRKIDWSYRTQPSYTSCLAMKDNRCNWPRGKLMGGSSVLNFMIYTRGNRRDYDRWAELGAEGWSFDEVLPYFKKLECSHIENADPYYAGFEGPVAISETLWKSDIAKAFVAAGEEIGLPYVDYNGPTQIGVSYLQTSTEKGRRASSNVAYLYPIQDRKNLFVRRLTTVTKIVIDRTTNTATGVEFIRKGKVITLHARKEVIVSAGAINSPQLLMMSGIGPREHLNDMEIKTIVDLPVGYNLMDHIAPGALTFWTNASTVNFASVLSNIGPEFVKFSKNGAGVLGSTGCESLMFLDLDDPSGDLDGYPDIELLQTAGAVHSSSVYRTNFGLKDSVYNAYVKPMVDKQANAFMIYPMVLRPRSRGRIMLKSSDPSHYPLIYANYLSDPYDIRVSVNGIKATIDLMDTEAFRKIDAHLYETPLPSCAHFGFGTDDYWECHTRHFTFTIYHYSGTCKMGAEDDPSAVVDPRLRVIGINSLRVVDASIFPEIVAGHPNSGVFMVAEKASDMIKEDWSNIV